MSGVKTKSSQTNKPYKQVYSPLLITIDTIEGICNPESFHFGPKLCVQTKTVHSKQLMNTPIYSKTPTKMILYSFEVEKLDNLVLYIVSMTTHYISIGHVATSEFK